MSIWGDLGGMACGAGGSPAAPNPGARAGVELRLQSSRDGLIASILCSLFLFLLILIFLLFLLLFVAVCQAPPPLHTTSRLTADMEVSFNGRDVQHFLTGCKRRRPLVNT